MPQIAVVGSLNLDTTVRVPRLPQPGETVLGSDHFSDTGGKGANQAVAAARLGRRVSMVGMVGDDDAGRQLIAALDRDGVDVSNIASSDTGSGMAVITVDEAGENMIVVDPGANGVFTVKALEPMTTAVATADVVVLQLEIPLPTVAAAVEMATGVVVLNPAPAASLDPEVLASVTVLVPNATELALLAGAEVPATPTDAIDLARRLDGPDAVVVTLGAAGAVVVGDNGALHVPAPVVEAVDPTAAGDAFCGGLADALVRGEGLEDAVRWAVRVGAVTATRWGAQSSLPTREEVLALGGTT
jgi:ribokinase